MNGTVISESDASNLKRLERVVERGRKAFVEVGSALREIRDSKLYRATHKTFAAYVEERFEFKRHNAYRLIEAAEAIESVDNCQQIENEGQAREVAKADPDDREAVIDRASEIAEERGTKPTAAIIAEARDEISSHDDSSEDEYEDWDPVDSDSSLELISFSDCADRFHIADNRMAFVEDLLDELLEHELLLVGEMIQSRLNTIDGAAQ